MATATLSQFRNESLADFSQAANRHAMEIALRKVRSEFGREYPLRIGKEEIRTGDTLTSVNPSNTSEIVGVHHKATAALANRVVEDSYAAFPRWAATPEHERVRMTLEVARLIRLRKFEFDAWLVYEAGKTWPEVPIETKISALSMAA